MTKGSARYSTRSGKANGAADALPQVSLQDLPEESLVLVLQHVTSPFGHLSPFVPKLSSSFAIIPKLACTCKTLHSMFMQDSIWKILCLHLPTLNQVSRFSSRIQLRESLGGWRNIARLLHQVEITSNEFTHPNGESVRGDYFMIHSNKVSVCREPYTKEFMIRYYGKIGGDRSLRSGMPWHVTYRKPPEIPKEIREYLGEYEHLFEGDDLKAGDKESENKGLLWKERCEFVDGLTQWYRSAWQDARLLQPVVSFVDEVELHEPWKDSSWAFRGHSQGDQTRTGVQHQDTHSTPKEMILDLLPVRYFEITVVAREGKERLQTSPWCVACGISTTSWSSGREMKKKQPGWDGKSAAMHSDDGRFFHNNFSTPQDCFFGPGDTIGCGLRLDLAFPVLFFTKNGKLFRFMSVLEVYPQLPNLRGKEYKLLLHPTIGIDSQDVVKMNVGTYPFKFDLSSSVLWQNLHVEGSIIKSSIHFDCIAQVPMRMTFDLSPEDFKQGDRPPNNRDQWEWSPLNFIDRWPPEDVEKQQRDWMRAICWDKGDPLPDGEEEDGEGEEDEEDEEEEDEDSDDFSDEEDFDQEFEDDDDFSDEEEQPEVPLSDSMGDDSEYELSDQSDESDI